MPIQFSLVVARHRIQVLGRELISVGTRRRENARDSRRATRLERV